jgi:hypothetical protein
MNLTWLRKDRPSLRSARRHSLMHAECPIEQTFRSDDAETQAELMREPWSQGKRPDGTLFVADYNGLRLLGRSEGALDAAVKPLQRRFEHRLAADPPSVRYAFGVPTLEPYMAVLIKGRAGHLSIVKKDLLRRRGRINRLNQGEPFILQGEAPLANLLGYERWLRGLMLEDSHAGLWLSRYLPIDDDGPQAA